MMHFLYNQTEMRARQSADIEPHVYLYPAHIGVAARVGIFGEAIIMPAIDTSIFAWPQRHYFSLEKTIRGPEGTVPRRRLGSYLVHQSGIELEVPFPKHWVREPQTTPYAVRERDPVHAVGNAVYNLVNGIDPEITVAHLMLETIHLIRGMRELLHNPPSVSEID